MAKPPPDKNTTTAFRKVFDNPDGKRVLRHIMVELGMFEQWPADDVEMAALSKFGFRLFELCGIWHEANSKNLVDAIMNTIDINLLLKDKDKENE